ncbi:MAG: glycosyltransferase family 2 protein [Rhodospirillales bacterium]|nr:glycosyltransferase family 2 protein [Rhodospirillales bacterium]
MSLLSIVVPCYNEEESVPEFHRRMSAAARQSAGHYEIVFVDDGSTDRTWPLLQELAATDSSVVAVKLSRNHGHQLALTAGLTQCRGERVLVIDADLQDPPELLKPMLALLESGADVVYGQRRTRKGETKFKTATAAVFYRLLRRLVDIEIPVDAGDFRLMSRRALEVLNRMPEHHRFIRGMVSWIGMRQVPILYDRDPRYAGETKYPLRKMIRFAIDAITGFSVAPLRLASFLGAAAAALSLLLMCYTLGSWLLGETIAGWTSLTSIVLLIGSVQLIVLGIIGEYLGRLYIEAKRRPLFVIETIAVGGSVQDHEMAVAEASRS